MAVLPIVVLNTTMERKSYRKKKAKVAEDNENRKVNQLRIGIQERIVRVMKKTTATIESGIHTIKLSMINPNALRSVSVIVISPSRIC